MNKPTISKISRILQYGIVKQTKHFEGLVDKWTFPYQNKMEI